MYKHSFTRYRDLHWLYFSYKTFFFFFRLSSISLEKEMATLSSSSMLLHCLLRSMVFAEKLAVNLTEAPCMWYITFTFQNPLSLFLLVVDFCCSQMWIFFFFSLSYLKCFISNLGSLGLLFLQIGFLLFFFFFLSSSSGIPGMHMLVC